MRLLSAEATSHQFNARGFYSVRWWTALYVLKEASKGTSTRSALQTCLKHQQQIFITLSDTPVSTQLRYRNVFCTPHIARLLCFDNSLTAVQYRLPLTIKPRKTPRRKLVSPASLVEILVVYATTYICFHWQEQPIIHIYSLWLNQVGLLTLLYGIL